jgi:hypothetical protein
MLGMRIINTRCTHIGRPTPLIVRTQSKDSTVNGRTTNMKAMPNTCGRMCNIRADGWLQGVGYKDAVNSCIACGCM